MTNDEKLDILLAKVDYIGNQMEVRLKRLEERMDRLEERMDRLEERMDRLEERMDRIEVRMDKIEADVRGIKLMLENEIRTNIQRVAEGHLDLARNLDKALQPSKELENLSIRVRVLETDVKGLKNKIS